ncbi:hypothetical protein HYH02_004425 [Chlamydomonas schloesseri]|uniref:Peptidase M11 gametolysin domain-containing protein n=1 Tax=Chlamydomonas schloesseri TaxID=2026947 RepID=A0A835WPZ8_9CHLO|nr:hypothetical protein HYH02_004425 [Chlamydomonas schloesseri]|eukprot:KAG2450585.1 hypothetical protein HYH02_004425 [Chlamydomonas schloesseri]
MLMLFLALAGWAANPAVAVRSLSQQATAGAADDSDRPGRGPPQLRGTLVTVTEFVDDWALIDDNGKAWPLKWGVKPKDKGGKPIPSGSIVGLTCPNVDATGQCTYFQDPTDATVISSTPTPNPTARTETILIMILDYSACRKPAETTVTAVTQQFFNAPTGSVSYADRFEQCSYSSLKLAPPGTNNPATNSRVVLLKPKPCPITVTQNTCDYWAMASNADSLAQAAGINHSAYTRKLYVLPSSLMSNTPGVGCYGWAAMATIGSNIQWYFSYSYGLNRWATVMQEYIHNYGLWHSWQNGIEYEDYSTAMGRGDSCPNAAEISFMKWARPAVSVYSPTGPSAGVSGLELNQASLPVGRPLLFNMPATYMTGAGNYIRVAPNWLGSSYTTNLYITALASAYKLVVTVGSWTRANTDGSSASDILRLYVCRFDVSDADTCNVKQTKRLSTIQPRVTSVVRFADNGELQALIAAAVQQQTAQIKAELQQQFKADLQQQDARSKAELQQQFKAEVQRKLRPFQQEFILNTVNELGKLVLLGLQPSKRATTHAKYSQPARLKKLASDLKMSPDGVQKMFEGIAVTRNTRTHAGSLQALRKAVTDAQEMIDELVAADPTLFVTDVNLSFSRDVLALYDTIEIDLLRSGRR